MKMNIAWHQKNLNNSKNYALREKKSLKNQIIKYKEMVQNNNFRQLQIDCAIKEGKEGFDEEKYKLKFKE